ncbi:MAG: ABC transporter ATP-binding protein [Mesorhizobium sp.]
MASRVSAGVTFAARLSFENICHSFNGDDPILSNISLTAEPGEVLCLLGPSGSGKTTLLRIAAGIESQKTGRVLMNEREIAGPSVFLPPEKRSIGLVFQDFALFPHMTILDNARFGLTALSRQESLTEARIALARVGLTHLADAYPHHLSGGEQQRVALARALAPRPSVLLMDEPFSGLDSRLKDSVRAETLAILRESRATAIVVTHDAEEAMRMGDRIALLKDGKLVQAGTAEELYLRPANLFAAGFFSEINVFDTVVAKGRASTPLGAFDASGFADGAKVSVAIRLSGILSGGYGVPARVVSRRYLGDVELVVAAVEGSDMSVRARLKAGTLPPKKRDITLSVRENDVLVFERADKTA